MALRRAENEIRFVNLVKEKRAASGSLAAGGKRDSIGQFGKGNTSIFWIAGCGLIYRVWTCVRKR